MRIERAFEAARAEGRAALMPYMMAGFPDRESSLAIAAAYADSGADLIELGVPFSDPLADGPIDPRRRDRGAGGRRDAGLGAGGLRVGVGPRSGRLHGLREHGAGAWRCGGVRPPRRRGRRRRGDRPRPAARRGRGGARRLRRRGPGAGAAGRADHAARAPRQDLRRRAGLRLRRLHRRDDRRARRAAAGSRRAGRRHQGRRKRPRGGRLRDRHAAAGRPGGGDRRRGDHRQPPRPGRRRGRLPGGRRGARSAPSCARRAPPSPGRISAAWDW